MKTKLFNQKGKELEDIEVSETVFNAKVSEKVLSQYVYIYLSNQREGNANVKDKSEVSGGGKKPYNQKGTGRARAGSNRSPIWRKGGVAHGPTNEVNYKLKTTKNFRKAAMQSAFTKVAQSGNLKFVDEISFDEKKGLTKQGLEVLNAFENPKKLLVIGSNLGKSVQMAFSNIKNVIVLPVTKINPYELLRGGTVLVHKAALEYITKNWEK